MKKMQDSKNNKNIVDMQAQKSINYLLKLHNFATSQHKSDIFIHYFQLIKSLRR